MNYELVHKSNKHCHVYENLQNFFLKSFLRFVRIGFCGRLEDNIICLAVLLTGKLTGSYGKWGK